MKTLQKLTKDFDYVDSRIENNFPLEPVRGEEYRLFHFDKYISLEDAVNEINKEGYTPANIHELLVCEDWNEKYWVVALGSAYEVRGGRRVPYLSRGGSERDLRLGWWGSDWGARCRFLGVRNSLSTHALGSSERPLESLTLESAHKKLDVLLNHFGLTKFVK